MKLRDLRSESEDISYGISGRYSKKRHVNLASDNKNGSGNRRNLVAIWRCSHCGYLDEGKEAPEICPACVTEGAGFELLTGSI